MMKLNQVYAGDDYKILKAEVPAGGKMPEHYATSDAFVVVVRGKAELIFSNSKLIVEAGMGFPIPNGKPHELHIREDFEAYITVGPEAAIEMVKNKANETTTQKVTA